MANYTVTTANDDSYDGGDLAAETADGSLSLREAVGLAQDGDTISFDASLSGSTITVTGSHIEIETSITIDGDINGDDVADITISGGNSVGMFYVFSGSATFESLIMTDGNTVTGGGAINGNSNASITVNNSTITGNTAQTGGGIYALGDLTITNSLISDNTTTTGAGGGVVSSGSAGGVDLTVSNSTITGNVSSSVGGIYVEFGVTADIDGSTISGNIATSSTGAHEIVIYGTGSSLDIYDSIIGSTATGAVNLLAAGDGTINFTGPVILTEAFTPSTGDGNQDVVSDLADIFDATTSTTLGGQTITVGVLADNGETVETMAIQSGGNADGTGSDGGNIGAGPDPVSNTPATFSGDTTGTLTEDDDTVGGDLNSTDSDGNDDVFVADTISGELGDLTIDASGNWVFDLDESNSDIQALGDDDTLIGTFTVQAEDGTEQDITVTLLGADDDTNYTVTTANDDGDDAYGGGTLAQETADGGGLSLREAIGLANANAGDDTITFDASLSGQTLTLGGAHIEVTSSIAIDGDIDGDDAADITISGGDLSTIFLFNAAGTASLNSLTLTNGLGGSGSGGAVYIYGSSNVTIQNTTIQDSEAISGGGIYVAHSAHLNLLDSLVTGNAATYFGGGIALASGATSTIVNSTITQNAAAAAAGVYHDGASLTFEGSTIFGNTANSGSNGQQIYISGDLDVSNSIIGNSESNTIYRDSGDVNFTGPVILTESFAPTSGDGNQDVVSDLSLIFDDTVSASVGGETVITGVLADNGGTVETMAIQSGGNADDTGSDGDNIGAGPDGNDPAVFSGDTTGTLTEDDDTVGGDLNSTDSDGNDDVFVADTISGDLGDLTIDASGNWVFDLDESNSDIQALGDDDTLTGTFTVQAEDGTEQDITVTLLGADDDMNYTVTTANVDEDDSYGGGDLASETADGGGLSLLEAIGLANANAGDDTITFDAGLNGQTITLNGPNISISSNITIDGDIDGDDVADITIDGDNTGWGIFTVTDGTVSFDSLTLTNGSNNNYGGAFNISSSANVTINNSTLSQNSADEGGAVYNLGTLEINNSVISNNSAAFGGGAVYSSSTGNVTINDSVIAGNSADVGGGINNSGVLAVNYSLINTNDATTTGGAIYSAGASSLVSISDTTITGNSGYISGGINLESDTIGLIDGSTISGNVETSGFSSHEIYVAFSSQVDISNSIIGSTASSGADLAAVLGGAINFTGPVILTEAFTPSSGDGNQDVVSDLSLIFDDTVSASVGGETVITGVLADNGGTVETMAIQSGGNADDTGSDGENIGAGPDGNEPAVFSGDTAGTLTEDDDTVGGDLNSTDSDGNDDVFVADTISGDLGDLTVDASGNWVFDLDENNGDLQALDGDDTITDTLTVTAEDGTEQDITISVTGVNDAAVISGATTGSLSEDDETVGGALSLTDVDGNDDSFAEDTISGDLGDLTIDASGHWVFDLDTGNGDLQALDGDDTLTDTFTVTGEDGTEQDITISVTGTNDAAQFGGNTSGTLGEDDDTVGGTITATDVDGTDNAFAAETVSGALGDLTIDASGNWVFDLDESNSDIQNLGDDETVTGTYAVEAADGTHQDITINVTGSDDEFSFEVTTLDDEAYSGGTLADELADGNGLSLREAIELANANGGADSIAFADSLSGGTITLGGTELSISDDLIIEGDIDGDDKADITIEGDGSSRLFNISDGVISLNSLTMTGGVANGASGGAVYVDLDADVTINDSRITGNLAYNGGGIAAAGAVSINNSLVDGNLGLSSGGGLYANSNYSVVSITNSTFTENLSDSSGGLYFGLGSIGTIEGSTIVANYGVGLSGGHEITAGYGGNVSLANSIIGSDASTGTNLYVDVGAVTNFTGPVILTQAFTPSSGDGNQDVVSDLADVFHETTTVSVNGEPLTAGTLADFGDSVDVMAILAGGNADDTGSDGENIGAGPDGNVPAVFSGDISGTMTEDGDTLSGDLNSTDSDGNDDVFVDDTLSGTLGDLTIDTSGNWIFDLDEGNGDLQALDGDDTLTETFTVEAEDGTEQDIEITVLGVDDAAVITGDTTGTIGEDDETIAGSLASTDVDGNDDVFVADTLSGTYGNLSIDADGDWVYDLDQDNASVIGLTGGSLEDTFTVQAEDGTEQDITISIVGENDAPSAPTLEGGHVIENQAGVLVGTLASTDDGGSVTFSVSDDRFVVVGNQLRLADGVSLDFEALTDGSLDVVVIATDAGGLSSSATFSIAVQDVGEFSGSDDADTLTGSDNRDLVQSGGGDDIISTMNGRDTIEAGDGNDDVSSGDDDDWIDGGNGDDVIDGGNGQDTLFGGQGGDNVGAGAGDDLVYAGRGDTGDDTVQGGDGDDSLGGGKGDDVLLGGDGADLMWGLDGNDLVDGGNGNDTLFNGEGDDTVLGGDGMDTLWAGAGDDILTGGARADTFVFGEETGSDTITDFDVTEDILNFEYAPASGFSSAADVVAAATATTQGGDAGVLIDLGTGETLFLVGISLSDVDDINYQF